MVRFSSYLNANHIDSKKHLKKSVGSTKVRPWFGPDLVHFLARPGVNLELTKYKSVCFLMVLTYFKIFYCDMTVAYLARVLCVL